MCACSAGLQTELHLWQIRNIAWVSNWNTR